MKAFLFRITLLIFLFALCLISFCEIIIPDDKIIEMTKETGYEKIAWDLNLINHDSARISNSIIFIGSSWVQGGINDSILCTKGRGKFINLAVSYGGADLDYYLINKIIKFHPKKILIQRFPKGQKVFHKMMPLLMSPIEYIITFGQCNTHFIFTYIPERFFFVIKSLLPKDEIFSNHFFKYYGRRSEGFKYVICEDFNKKTIILNKKAERQLNKVEFINSDGVKQNINSKNVYNNIWRVFLSYTIFGNGEVVRKSTIELCNSKNIDVNEFYVPHYADAIFDEKNIDTNYFCRPDGFKNKCIFIKNVAFLANQKNWLDPDHLNSVGSNVFTDSIYNSFFKKSYYQ